MLAGAKNLGEPTDCSKHYLCWDWPQSTPKESTIQRKRGQARLPDLGRSSIAGIVLAA